MTASPLSVISSLPPQFSEAEACQMARDHYGIEASAKVLVSERDQNFLLQARDGLSWVLKIANVAEDPQFTDFQIKALQYIVEQSRNVPVPAIRRTKGGADSLQIDRNGHLHVVRLVRWLPGKPLDADNLNAGLCRNLGVFLAQLGQSLHGFSHPGGAQTLLWDMRQALALQEVLPLIADANVRGLLAGCLDDFANCALPVLPQLRAQVIHNDFNPDNILMDAGDPNRVAGVIDFGDMQFAPLVIDVAIGASYLRNTGGDPLHHIAEFVAGYHGVTPLTLTEIDLLYDLVNTRLATTVAILAWRSGARAAGDAYLDKASVSESSAAPFLARLRELPRADVQQRLRQVCASVAVQRD
ncbi:MAG: phosphotransferase [Woeseia sp.]